MALPFIHSYFIQSWQIENVFGVVFFSLSLPPPLMGQLELEDSNLGAEDMKGENEMIAVAEERER